MNDSISIRLHRATRTLVVAALTISTLTFAAPAAARRGDRTCESCGTVVTTNRKDQKSGGTAGAVVGGLGGAVAGNAIGGNTTGTVLGGVGGALAGNVIGKKLGTKKIWSVQVRMDGGGTQDVDFTSDPGYRQGQRVRVVDGTLQRL